jgi:hypothetical protein
MVILCPVALVKSRRAPLLNILCLEFQKAELTATKGQLDYLQTNSTTVQGTK